MLTFIDFFAGIGGFRRGMELAGHKCLGVCVFDKFAMASYTAMHCMTDEDCAYAVWCEKYKCYVAIRRLTPKECFRLQGWEDVYFERAALVNSDSQLYRQAGNGVTVPVIRAIAERMEI